MPNAKVIAGKNGAAYPFARLRGEGAGRRMRGDPTTGERGRPKYKAPVFSNRRKRRKTARMMLNRLTIDLRISGPAFRAL